MASLPCLGSHAGVFAQLCGSAKLIVSSPSPMVLHVGSTSQMGLNVCSPSPTALSTPWLLCLCAGSHSAMVLHVGFSFAYGAGRVFSFAYGALRVSTPSPLCLCVGSPSPVALCAGSTSPSCLRVGSPLVFQLFAGLYKVPVSTAARQVLFFLVVYFVSLCYFFARFFRSCSVPSCIELTILENAGVVLISSFVVARLPQSRYPSFFKSRN